MYFKGLIAAAFTPFEADGKVDYNRIQSLTEFLISQKLAGLFVCGSTGECSSLTMSERKLVAEAFIKAAAKRIPVIVHVGSTSVEEAAELAKHAQSAGADAVSAVAPWYFKPRNVEMLVASMRQIAAGAPDLPFYFYHIPALTNVNFSMYEFLQKADGVIPNLAGIKFTYENLMDFQLALNYKPEKFQVLFGRDEILLAGLALGAVGGIGSTYNYATPLYHEIINAFNAGDLAKARHFQLLSQKLVLLLIKYGDSSSKQIMDLIGQNVGGNRLPLQNTFASNPQLAADLKMSGVAGYLGGKLND